MKKSLLISLTTVVIFFGFTGCASTVPKPASQKSVKLDRYGKALGYAVINLKKYGDVVLITPNYKKYKYPYLNFKITENGYFPENNFGFPKRNFYFEFRDSKLADNFIMVKKILKSKETLSLVGEEFRKMNISNYKSFIKSQKIRLAKEEKARKIRLAKKEEREREIIMI